MSKDEPRDKRSVQYLSYSVDSHTYSVENPPPNPVHPVWGTPRWRLAAAVVAASLILIVAGVGTARHPKIGPPQVGNSMVALHLLRRGIPLEITAGPLVVLLTGSRSGDAIKVYYVGHDIKGHGFAAWGGLEAGASMDGHGQEAETGLTNMPDASTPVKAAWTTHGTPHHQIVPLARAYALTPHNGPQFQGQGDGLRVTFQETVRHGPDIGMWSGTLKVAPLKGSLPIHLTYSLNLHGGRAGGIVPASGMVHLPTNLVQPSPPGINPDHPRIGIRWSGHAVLVPMHRVVRSGQKTHIVSDTASRDILNRNRKH